MVRMRLDQGVCGGRMLGPSTGCPHSAVGCSRPGCGGAGVGMMEFQNKEGAETLWPGRVRPRFRIEPKGPREGGWGACD